MATAFDTIFALSSGRPPAAVAVVRVCGPRAGAVLETLIGGVPPPRRASLARVRDPKSAEVIDEALAIWLPGPRSETGEDMAELQLHGGRAVIAGVLEALGGIEGCRPAEPGEFTRRAFENGRLDLTAAEGLADLIAAETQAQRRHAFRQLKGLIGERADAWRRMLIDALALVEARIDFSDEADVPEDLITPALLTAGKLHQEIAAALAGARRGERLREGLTVAIGGPPNAGKSTLLNRIARREVAIVSPHAGTTRDVLEVHLDLDGFPILLLDTAGIRDGDDPVEQEGVRRARARAAAADLVLWVIDSSADGGVAHTDEGIGRTTAEPQLWMVLNKTDLLRHDVPGRTEHSFNSAKQYFAVSARTGSGIDALLEALSAYAADCFSAVESALITRARHRRLLEETLAALERASAEGAAGREELLAEELRAAATALGRLTGRVDVEDVLDAVFRDFCIGK